LNFPTNNDTANVGEWLAENSAASAQDTVFGNVALNAWKASSDYMLISRELLQDSKFDIEGYVNGLIAERLGRLTNTAYTVGDGSSKPNGVADASTLGVVTASALAVDFDDLLELKHSVDRDYRQNAVWMLNDTVLKDLKKTAIASANQSLWQPGIVGGEPATIDGQRYVINNDLADVAASSHSVLYGDFSKYVIRDVTGIEVLRSDQLNMLKNQITLVGFMRTDGDLIDTNAVKHLRTLGT
jgi:HK97 family phage major capsid protein